MFRYDLKNIYKAALVVIGNEILTGRTPDTNTAWMAQKFIERGVIVVEVRVIPDIEEKIIKAVNELRAEVDYVFTTGGIGPTHDDITSASIAKAFGVPLELNAEAVRALTDNYGTKELSPPRAKMAMIPKGARLIPNPVSAAPGFIIGNVHVMAGVPRIMHAMLDHVLETLTQGEPILSNTISCNLPESAIAEEMAALQDRHAEVEIGSYPHYRGGVAGLNLVVRGTSADKIKAATLAMAEMIRSQSGEAKALSLQVGIEDL